MNKFLIQQENKLPFVSSKNSRNAALPIPRNNFTWNNLTPDHRKLTNYFITHKTASA